MKKDISRVVKDCRRFEWGLKEFFPEAYYVKMQKPLSEEKVYYVQYQIVSGRDKVKGYVENFREYN
jgi:hypothetical protein